MKTKEYKGQKYSLNGEVTVNDFLSVEEALQINVNYKSFTVTMRTPGDDIALTRGLLHSENVISDHGFSPIIAEVKKKSKNALAVVNVVVPLEELGRGYSIGRSLISVSSCGICGKTELENFKDNCDPIESNARVSAKSIEKMFAKMSKMQSDFLQSGGCHASAAFDNQGQILSIMEDIGRHNAVDKVVGELILSNRLKDACCLTVSGRISYEIIVKCFKAKIPIIAAVSAPSSLAVDYAQEFGITLVAFCRNNRATCYTNAERVVNEEIKTGNRVV